MFTSLSRALERLRDVAPDPRVGRGLEAALAGPPEHMFRSDQVAHLVAVGRSAEAEPSFADLLLPLVVVHGDAGTAERLLDHAAYARVDADCYGMELVRRLQEAAAILQRRYPSDRPLDPMVGAALRNRALDMTRQLG